MPFVSLIRTVVQTGLLCTLVTVSVRAQTPVTPPVVEFGQVTAADFQVRSVPNDTTAEAIVLYESAQTRYIMANYITILITDYHSRIRINKKSAYGYATQEYRLRGQGDYADTMTKIDAITYKLTNGQVTQQKMDKQAIVSERVSANSIIKKFTLPTVEEGCIIEYRYSISVPGALLPGTWSFQQTIPVLWSDYKVAIPTDIFLNITLKGYLPLTINYANKSASEPYTNYHFAMADVPAFQNEPFIPSPSDYMARITFDWAKGIGTKRNTEKFMADWSDLDRNLLKGSSFGEQYFNFKLLKKEIEFIKNTYGIGDTVGRVSASYDYIRQLIGWNQNKDIVTNQLNNVLSQKKGDAADINLMLTGLLRAVGVDANPVILSTRDHGSVDTSVSTLGQFNYVVAHVELGGKDVLLDATDRFLKFGMLPRRALNGTGRLILPNGKSRFIPLTPFERDLNTKVISLLISDEGELSGTITETYDGLIAADIRNAYTLINEEKLIDLLKKLKPEWELKKVVLQNTDSINKPFQLVCTLTIADAVQLAGDRMYIYPLLTEGMTKNPFIQLERKFPVDFAVPFDEMFTATIQFPAGYVVDELPKPMAISLPKNGGRFTYQIQQKENKLDVLSRITIRKSIFSAVEYGALKEFYEKILSKHAEQLVLKKLSISEK